MIPLMDSVNFSTYWRLLSPDGKQTLARRARVGYTYLSLIASGRRQPGAVAAIRIEEATERVVRRRDLRPDLFGD